MNRFFLLFSLGAFFFGMTSCQSASKHYDSLPSVKDREMTVGIVQREVRKGMSAADVASILGSPNIVTTDAEGGEVWIYDKISTDVSYSRGSGGVGGGVGVIGMIIGGGVGGGYSGSSGAASQTQRTLTVVIKFDTSHLVRDFSYHSSKF